MKKKILIIGSNSFSAGSLIKILLKKNYKIIGISRSKLNDNRFLPYRKTNKNYIFRRLDINKDIKKIILIIKKNRPSHIINYASQSMVGESWINPVDWYRTNSYSMIKFLNEISKLKFNFKLIQISTPEMYGNIKKITSENENYNPTTPYAASRVTADHFLKLLYKQNKINYVLVRPSNVYGECQRLYRIVPRTIYSILKQRKLNLHGGGFSKRNYIHIDDVSEGIYKLMFKGKNGNCYHISSNRLISIREIVKKICKKMNYKFDDLVKISAARRGTDAYYFLSSAKIKKELKWKQKILIDEGIEKSIEWVKNNLRYFSKKDLSYIHKK
tara:strand:+ start:2278 stop:3264 length:987 start_codon:yes stop_codon:yes gene_type:complete